MNMYLKLLLPKELALNAPNTVWRTDPLGYREGYRKVGEDRGGEGKGTMRGPLLLWILDTPPGYGN